MNVVKTCLRNMCETKRTSLEVFLSLSLFSFFPFVLSIFTLSHYVPMCAFYIGAYFMVVLYRFQIDQRGRRSNVTVSGTH